MFLRAVCYLCLLLINTAFLKPCQKTRGLTFIIDSTKEVTKDDFELQRHLIELLLNEFEEGSFSISVQVYHGNNQCSSLVDKLSEGFYDLKVMQTIINRLSLLQHAQSNVTFDLKCAYKSYQAVQETDINKASKYGIVLAKFSSIKPFIDEKEFKKYNPNGTYYVAVIYNATSNPDLINTISRRKSNINSLIPALVQSICPLQSLNSATFTEFSTASINSTLLPTDTSYSMSSISMRSTSTVADKSEGLSSKFSYKRSTTTIFPTEFNGTSTQLTSSYQQPSLTVIPYKSNVYSTGTPSLATIPSYTNSISHSFVENYTSSIHYLNISISKTLLLTISQISDYPTTFFSAVNNKSISLLTQTPMKNITYTSLRLSGLDNTSAFQSWHLKLTPTSLPYSAHRSHTDGKNDISTIQFMKTMTHPTPMLYSSFQRIHASTEIRISPSTTTFSLSSNSSTDEINIFNTSSFNIPQTSKDSIMGMTTTPHTSIQLVPNNSYLTANISSLKSNTPAIVASTKMLISSSLELIRTSVLNQSVTRSNSIQKVDLSSVINNISSKRSLESISPTNSFKELLTSSISILDAHRKRINEFVEKEAEEWQVQNKTWVDGFFLDSAKLLQEVAVLGDLLTESNRLTDFVEDVFAKVGGSMEVNESMRMKSNETELEVFTINSEKFPGYTFVSNVNDVVSVSLPKSLFLNSVVTVKTVIISMRYRRPQSWKSLKRGQVYADDIISLSLRPPVDGALSEPLLYTQVLNQKNVSNYECVFWNGSDFDTSGCSLLTFNGSNATCQCNHMTPFTVLMQVKNDELPHTHHFVLNLITYIGCGCSMFACLGLILTFMMCGRLTKIDRNLIHINLAIAICLSNGLFLAADSVYEYKGVCLGVSVSMLYSYMASFFWMLVEGVHVYLMIVKVFRSPRQMTIYVIIGWVIPAIIVTLTSLKYHKQFTREDFCWLSTENNVIWIFVGPALFIVAVNSVILVLTLRASHKMSVDETEFAKIKQIARLTLLLMPIFGLTWIFGLLAVNKKLLVFHYIFTAVNSFQGVFMFVCYCLLNDEVKREYAKIKRKSQYYSSTKSSASSDNGFSVYIHPHQRKRLKSFLSTSDSMSAVQLTKFALTSPSAIYSTALDTDKSLTDTLTKSAKKEYSIELLQFPQSTICDDEISVCSNVPFFSQADFTSVDSINAHAFNDAHANNDIVVMSYQV